MALHITGDTAANDLLTKKNQVWWCSATRSTGRVSWMDHLDQGAA